jgi:hypothetical protein
VRHSRIKCPDSRTCKSGIQNLFGFRARGFRFSTPQFGPRPDIIYYLATLLRCRSQQSKKRAVRAWFGALLTKRISEDRDRIEDGGWDVHQNVYHLAPSPVPAPQAPNTPGQDLVSGVYRYLHVQHMDIDIDHMI